MTVMVLALAAIALWALIRLGRQTERAGRGHWRITATLLAAVMLGGAALAAARGSWIPAAALGVGGLWLTLASRKRDLPARRPDLDDAEARSLLGLPAGATPDQINAAWRRLMARAHPDQGGTEGLAARLNAARDRLLKR
ncbi:MAG TPA: molecular chaperone DnaJ [Brevundimonas sp.]|jgi:hypothetical protein|uniref:molecular chaperone DnaJ n=1 Tax=Brevundimonas sp. TaxID=1871086 RepID=UPI002DF34D09|nr:molecular chaperone DnaJ [Brevundimonas sp.]